VQLAFTLLTLPAFARAEQLPIRVYSTADGLPSNQISCVKRDSRGFLWFCTAEGLSRFDGYTFTNYGVDQGLPDRVVNAFLETRSGDYWVATQRGLARFNPKPSPKAPMFTVFRPAGTVLAQHVNALLEDHQNRIWAGTDEGVFQVVQVGGQRVLRRPDLGLAINGAAEGFVEDHDGNLWIAVYDSYGGVGEATLCRRDPGGRLDIFRDDFLRVNRILTILEDREKHIWLGTYHGLALLAPHPQVGGRLIERVYSKRDGLSSDEVRLIFQASDGHLWANAGLLVSGASGKQVRFQQYSPEGQRFDGVWAEDSGGNLWGGAESALPQWSCELRPRGRPR